MTRVMPCLLLRNAALVKTVRFRRPSYVGDPVNTVRIFNEKEVDELVLLDITATVEEKKPPLELITEIAGECFMPLTYGGGIRSLDDASSIFSAGVEKIVINSQAVEDPAFISRAADRFGSQSIVVSLDCKKKLFGGYEVVTRSGTRRTGHDPARQAAEMVRSGAGELLVTSIDREGTMRGYDLELLKRVTAEVDVPVIANGGAGSLGDLSQAVHVGNAAAAAAGSLVVYQGPNRAVLINFPSPGELASLFTNRAA